MGGVVRVHWKRCVGNGYNELRHARSFLLWKKPAVDDHRPNTSLQQVQDPKCVYPRS